MRTTRLPVCMHQILLVLAVCLQINELSKKTGFGFGCDALRMINLDAPQMALQGDTIRLTCSFRLANDEFKGSRQDDEKRRIVPSHPDEHDPRGLRSNRADKRVAASENVHSLFGKSANLSTNGGGGGDQFQSMKRRRSLEIDTSSAPEMLYAIKWYKDEREFYQFITRNWPHKHALPMNGLNIDMDKSDNQTVVLRSVSLKTSGLFRCEVSTDAPSFLTKSIERKIFIYSLPVEGPTIETSPPRVRSSQLNLHLGDQLEFRCLSRESKPQTELDWIMNDKVNLSVPTPTTDTSFPRAIHATNRRFIKMPKIRPTRETSTKSDEPIPFNDKPISSATTHELIEVNGRTLARPLDGSGSCSPLSGSALDQLPETSMSVLNFTVSADFIQYLQIINGQRLAGSHHQKWLVQKILASSMPNNTTFPGFSLKTKKANGDQRKLGPNKQFDIGPGWPLDIRCVARVMHLSMSDTIRLRVFNSSRDTRSSTLYSSLDTQRQERRTQSNSAASPGSNSSKWIFTFYVAWTMSQSLLIPNLLPC